MGFGGGLNRDCLEGACIGYRGVRRCEQGQDRNRLPSELVAKYNVWLREFIFLVESERILPRIRRSVISSVLGFMHCRKGRDLLKRRRKLRLEFAKSFYFNSS